MNVTYVGHKTNALSVANNFVDYGKEWIVESGCSHHATGNDTLLSNVCPHDGKKVIVTADDSLHPVMKEGHFKEGDSNVVLEDVYHAPGLKRNLASVS